MNGSKMAILRIAYIEDEDNQHRKYSPIIGRLFASGVYKVEVQRFVSESAFSDYAKNIHPHIVIVDMKIDKVEFEGLRIIAKFKDAMPYSVFCVLSRESLTFTKLGVHRPNADFLISKVVLGSLDEDYLTYVRRAVLSRVRRAFIGEIVIEGQFDEVFGKLYSRDSDPKHISEIEVRSIVEQVTFAGDVSNESNIYRRVLLEPLPGGYSGAIVLKMRVFRNGSDNIIGVIKISPVEFSELEFANYERFVKWTLPYTWRVEVMGTARTSSFGAVCYSFVFDGQGTPRAVSDFLREGNTSIIPIIAETIFNPAKKTWYGNVRDTKRDFSDYFSSVPFFRDARQMEHREQRFIEVLRNVFPDEKMDISNDKLFVNGNYFPRPAYYLFSNEWSSVLETVCHGDMNANNIMYEERSGTIAFIDFQRTGFNQIFRDFVSLESSVRVDWIEAKADFDFSALLKEELKALELDEKKVRQLYLKQIILIRKKAEENFFPIGLRQYYFSTIIHLWWLLVRFDHWSPTGYRRLCIGVLASLKWLEKSGAR